MKLYVYNFRYSHNSIDVCESRLSLHKTTPGTHMVYERGVNFVCIGLHCIHQFIDRSTSKTTALHTVHSTVH